VEELEAASEVMAVELEVVLVEDMAVELEVELEAELEAELVVVMVVEVLLVALDHPVLLQAMDLQEEADLIKQRTLLSQSNQLMDAFQTTLMNSMVSCGVNYRAGDQGIQKSTTEICKEYFHIDMALPINCSSFLLSSIYEHETKINNFRF
jgi:hypothetical protein